jgi:hypothetical protein
MTIERRYAMTRLSAGDYVFPSNDASLMLRVWRYDDAPTGDHRDGVRPYWAAGRYRGTADQAVASMERDLGDHGYVDHADWIETDSFLRTRQEAIDDALRSAERLTQTTTERTVQMDIDVTSDSELMVAQAEGLTDAGVDFVDRFTTPQMEVPDAGRIIVPTDVVPALLDAARQEGLQIEVRDVTTAR